MHILMTMPPARPQTTLRRRPDGLVQILTLPRPAFSLGTLRSFGLGLVGLALLVAALVAAPLWLALGGRPASAGRAGARTADGANVTELTGFRR
jgi:hypothetical protein